MLHARVSSDDASHSLARASRSGRRPNVSVVAVATQHSVSTLKSVAERAARWDRLGVEFIFVCGRPSRRAVESIAGNATVICGPSSATDSELRALGLDAASGDVVMLLGDPAAADDLWIERLIGSGAMREASRDA